MVKVLADKYLHNITNFFSEEVNLQLYDPDEPLNDIPADTQALLIRTVTKINSQTFPSFPEALQFIGTGSAGSDHVDIPYLKEQGITFANAAGCNARSVAEYVATALLLWADANDINIKENSVGIIGVGHTGGEVQKILQEMDVPTIGYDPPRDKRNLSFQSASLDEVLQGDILTFHTPLTQDQPNPTYHWLNAAELSDRTFKLVINAARGGIINEEALLNAHKKGKVGDFILDVWENEPVFNDDTARRAFLKTPHIAGYSLQAKNRATQIICKALADHFSIELPAAAKVNHSSEQPSPSTFWSLTDILTFYHPIRTYETRFLMLIGRPKNGKIKGFNAIRTHHPLRTELQFKTLSPKIKKSYPLLKPLFIE